MDSVKEYIAAGQAVLGIEFGSTRIKAVMIGPDHSPIASGSYSWENRLENGVWTYHNEDIMTGLQTAYADLKSDVQKQYGVTLTAVRALGISAMMHGYLPFDKDWKQLAEFRTWRNTMTARSAAELTELFSFNIPQRWSIAHFDRAVLENEAHVKDVAHLTTLAGYIHFLLTGRNVLGVGEASGMFPIDSAAVAYDAGMAKKYNARLQEKGVDKDILELLPAILQAGDSSCTLTEAGAKLLDPSGDLKCGAVVCPPEGDAGTGMAATNSVAVRTGNVSAGTSIFSMVVLEKPLSKVYPEIDMVTTPTGKPVAMVHCNNCTSDLNAWVNTLKGFAEAVGAKVTMDDLYRAVYTSAMKADKDCGGVVDFCYISSEPVCGCEDGRPMLLRAPGASMNFDNFARALLSAALVSLKIGNDILAREHVRIDALLGHGGFFKTTDFGQRLMAGAFNTAVSVMETAGEGGPWGMALLAAFAVNGKPGQTLEEYLSEQVFAGQKVTTVQPDPEDAKGFDAYTARYIKALPAQRAAAAMD